METTNVTKIVFCKWPTWALQGAYKEFDRKSFSWINVWPLVSLCASFEGLIDVQPSGFMIISKSTWAYTLFHADFYIALWVAALCFVAQDVALVILCVSLYNNFSSWIELCWGCHNLKLIRSENKNTINWSRCGVNVAEQFYLIKPR